MEPAQADPRTAADAAEPVRAHHPLPSRPIMQIYVDESNRRRGRDLIGGLQIRAADEVATRSRIEDVRAQHGWLNPRGEFKWKKASGCTLLSVYVDLVDAIMDLITAGRATFFCLATRRPCRLPAAQQRKSLRANRFWSILVERYLVPTHLYEVIVDARTDLRDAQLAELRQAINEHAQLRHRVGGEYCHTVETRNSKADDLIQVVDVLLGAVGYHVSERHLDAGASVGKGALARRICAHLDIPDLRVTARSPYFVVAGSESHCQ